MSSSLEVRRERRSWELEVSCDVSLAPRKWKNWSRVSPSEPEATMLRTMAMDIGETTAFEPFLTSSEILFAATFRAKSISTTTSFDSFFFPSYYTGWRERERERVVRVL